LESGESSLLNETEQETAKKPKSNRSAKERRNTLFRVLDGVLSLSHRKIHAEGNSDRAKQGLIINFMLYMKKQGLRPTTISNRAQLITTLLNQGADLNNPEDVKFVIADKKCRDGYKKNLVIAYDTLLRMRGIKWDPPKYKRRETLPFIPYESEINQLISATGRRMSIYLHVLKETGADPGEALEIRWDRRRPRKENHNHKPPSQRTQTQNNYRIHRPHEKT
jgi:hypothetical protein